MKSSRLAAAVLLLAWASGAAALMHQLLWTRRLIDLLGASAESTTRVFGCFFLGLALGAAVAARRVGTVRRPWLALAGAECGVALLALPTLFLPQWTGWIWPALGAERLATWPGGAVKLLLSALAIVPPAFCMGHTLPLMAAGWFGRADAADRRGVWLYAVNTLGGASGLLVVAGFALQTLGARGSMTAACAANLAVAAGAFVLDRRTRTTLATADAPASGRAPAAGLLLLAFFSGAAVLATEVAATQLVMLVATLSFHAPAAILFSVILLLALAAFAAPMLARIGHRRLVVWALALTGVLLAAAPAIFMAISQQWNGLAQNTSVAAFTLKLSALVLVTFGPALLAAGLVFPLLLAWPRTSAEISDGPRLGWLLAVNGLGGLIGAECCHRLLLPMCGVHLALGIIGAGYGLTALVLSLRGNRRAFFLPAGACIVVALLTMFVLRGLPTVNPRAGFRVVDQQTGREGTVAVVESEHAGRAILLSNQYLLGGTVARWNQERQALLPLLLHPAPRRMGFIGLATGITPGAVLADPGLEKITAVELSPLVVRAADTFFGDFNAGITRPNPRAQVVIEDGRTFFAASPESFDVIAGDLFLPWSPGEARLYSIEHFRDVRRALRPGGVFCQWLAMYQLTPEQFRTIADTFAAAFPDTHLFTNGFRGDSPALALVGWRDAPLDWPAIATRTAAARDFIRDPLLRHVEGIAMLYLGRWQPTPGGALNTLGNLRVELDAGRERLTGNPAAKYLAHARWFQFCAERRTHLDARREMPTIPDAPKLQRLADLWMQYEYLQRTKPAAAQDMRSLLESESPRPLRDDPAADWTRWPGTGLPWARGQ